MEKDIVTARESFQTGHRNMTKKTNPKCFKRMKKYRGIHLGQNVEENVTKEKKKR